MGGLELVVFDVAGTTVHDAGTVGEFLRGALLEAGVDVAPARVNALMGQPKPVAIRTLLTDARGAAPAEDEVARIHARFHEKIVRFYATDGSVRAEEGAVETFRWLRKRRVKVALDTGFDRKITDTILARLGWTVPEVLDATVTSDEVPRGRPAPDLIERAMKLTGVGDPARVAKVGDTPSDIEEGRAARCGVVVAVTRGSHRRGALEGFAGVHLVPSVAVLPELLVRLRACPDAAAWLAEARLTSPGRPTKMRLRS